MRHTSSRIGDKEDRGTKIKKKKISAINSKENLDFRRPDQVYQRFRSKIDQNAKATSVVVHDSIAPIPYSTIYLSRKSICGTLYLTSNVSVRPTLVLYLSFKIKIL